MSDDDDELAALGRRVDGRFRGVDDRVEATRNQIALLRIDLSGQIDAARRDRGRLVLLWMGINGDHRWHLCDNDRRRPAGRLAERRRCRGRSGRGRGGGGEAVAGAVCIATFWFVLLQLEGIGTGDGEGRAVVGDVEGNVMVGVLACALVVTTPLGWVWSSKRRAGLVRTFQGKHGLVLDPATRPVAERLLVAQRRGQHVGAMVGFAVMVALLIVGPFTGDHGSLGSLSLLLVFTPVMWLQTLVGAVAVSVAARPEPGAPRVARLTEPSLADDLQRWLRWWGPGALTVATAVAAVYIASPPAGDGWLGRTGAAIGLGIAALSVLLNEITMRRLLHAPQPASNTSQLALRDVIKGEALAELAAGIVPSFLAALLLMERFPLGPLFWLPLGAAAVPLVLQRDQRRHMRDRLWPVPRPARTEGPVANGSRTAP